MPLFSSLKRTRVYLVDQCCSCSSSLGWLLSLFGIVHRLLDNTRPKRWSASASAAPVLWGKREDKGSWSCSWPSLKWISAWICCGCVSLALAWQGNTSPQNPESRIPSRLLTALAFMSSGQHKHFAGCRAARGKVSLTVMAAKRKALWQMSWHVSAGKSCVCLPRRTKEERGRRPKLV